MVYFKNNMLAQCDSTNKSELYIYNEYIKIYLLNEECFKLNLTYLIKDLDSLNGIDTLRSWKLTYPQIDLSEQVIATCLQSYLSIFPNLNEYVRQYVPYVTLDGRRFSLITFTRISKDNESYFNRYFDKNLIVFFPKFFEYFIVIYDHETNACVRLSFKS